MDLEYLLAVWRPGSQEWSWAAEFSDLLRRDHAQLVDLVEDIAARGIQEPVLLGEDKRVWDGHHRLFAARLLGLSVIPIQHSGDLRRDDQERDHDH